MAKHQVLLVPGFFGFGQLGELTYFVGVREALEREFRALGLDVTVSEVATLPTASIRFRAAKVRDRLAALAAESDGPIHIVGHSTGGLDARLAIAPTASLPSAVPFVAYDRVHSLVTIATPHFGTPVATFFSSTMGKPLLRLLALATVFTLRRGRLPLGVLIKAGRLFSRLDDLAGMKGTVLDQLFNQLLGEFDAARQKEILEFVVGVAGDQSLVFQLTPAACDLLNASTADPDGVRYGSVTTLAPKTSAGAFWRHGADLYAQGMHVFYAALHTIAARSMATELPPPASEQRAVLEASYGRPVSSRDNDGLIPTISQVWGTVIHASRADHLDVVGHFGRSIEGHTESDWLPSDARFDERAFSALWSDVARFITYEILNPASKDTRQPGVERTELPHAR